MRPTALLILLAFVAGAAGGFLFSRRPPPAAPPSAPPRPLRRPKRFPRRPQPANRDSSGAGSGRRRARADHRGRRADAGRHGPLQSDLDLVGCGGRPTAGRWGLPGRPTAGPTGLPPGPCDVVARAGAGGEFASEPRRVTIPWARRAAPVVLTLAAVRGIRGRVLVPDATCVDGLSVEARAEADQERVNKAAPDPTRGSRMALRGLPPGRYLLTLTGLGEPRAARRGRRVGGDDEAGPRPAAAVEEGPLLSQARRPGRTAGPRERHRPLVRRAFGRRRGGPRLRDALRRVLRGGVAASGRTLPRGGLPRLLPPSAAGSSVAPENWRRDRGPVRGAQVPPRDDRERPGRARGGRPLPVGRLARRDERRRCRRQGLACPHRARGPLRARPARRLRTRHPLGAFDRPRRRHDRRRRPRAGPALLGGEPALGALPDPS